LPIFNDTQVPVPCDEIFRQECNYQTTKNESFADDSTTLTYFDYSDLSALKENLEAFSVLSGLKCNFEKTTIVRFGDIDTPPDPNIISLGFTIENECKLLGFTVSQGPNMYKKNFEILLDKVKKNHQLLEIILSLAHW
jgi:hypothetical protein